MADATPATVAAPAPASDQVSASTWLTVFGGVLGAFIAVLNIHITNASLKDIQGALGATLEEGSFISTAYLTAEIVVIPITGWLTQVFGLRRYILWNTVFFMGFTTLCAMAWNLESMLVFRALAGFTRSAWACSPSPPPRRPPSARPWAAFCRKTMAGRPFSICS